MKCGASPYSTLASACRRSLAGLSAQRSRSVTPRSYRVDLISTSSTPRLHRREIVEKHELLVTRQSAECTTDSARCLAREHQLALLVRLNYSSLGKLPTLEEFGAYYRQNDLIWYSTKRMPSGKESPHALILVG